MEAHLSQAYAKLSIGSRARVAAALGPLGGFWRPAGPGGSKIPGFRDSLPGGRAYGGSHARVLSRDLHRRLTAAPCAGDVARTAAHAAGPQAPDSGEQHPLRPHNGRK